VHGRLRCGMGSTRRRLSQNGRKHAPRSWRCGRQWRRSGEAAEAGTLRHARFPYFLYADAKVLSHRHNGLCVVRLG
jgi:hypothetical protein